MKIADYLLNHPWLVAAIEDERVAPWLPALQVAWLVVTMPVIALHGRV